MASPSAVPSQKQNGPVAQLVSPAFQVAIPAAAALILFSGGIDAVLSSRITKTLAVMLALVLVRNSLKFRKALASWSLGCSPATAYPHKDPFLGIDFFLRVLKSMRAGMMIECFHNFLERFDGTFTYSALGTPTIVTSRPENIKTLLYTNFEDWPIAGPRKDALSGLLGDTNIFQSNGAMWQQARALIRPTFVRDQIADLRCFDRHTTNMIAKIPLDGGTTDLQQLFFMMTMDSSSDFILGHCTNLLTTGSSETRKFNDAFDYALLTSATRTRLGRLATFFPDKRYEDSRRTVREYVARYVGQAIELQDKKGSCSADDRSYVFLSELVKKGVPTEYICDQVAGIFLAGRDTTAAALSAMFWLLARHPDVVRRLRDEVCADLGGEGREQPTWEELKNMTFLQHVIKEVLRLYPPVATNSRGAARDTIFPVGGGPEGKAPMFVAKGTICRWSTYTLHRNKDFYGHDADEFNPDRWDHIRPTWEYGPFSGGPRICPGQQFAITQISLTAFKLLRAFKKIEPRDDRPLLQNVSTTISLINGVNVGMVPA